ncbi:tail fiber domain-containing protein [Blastomonas sp.]|uniref:tail fiber domain-containing protein n=1 Tax=Blastomonas sp. TaxID=1909299 RepID=UPI00406A52CB
MPDLFFADLVRETSTATGTGALALGGATPGHRRFADAVPAGERFHYAVAGVTHEDQWEVGEGRLEAGALLRDTVLASSSGARVDFAAGLKTVTLTVAAQWFAEREDRSGHVHAIDQVEGLAAALAGKQPVGSYAPLVHGHDNYAPLTHTHDGYAPMVHTHDFMPRDAAGNWVTGNANLGVGGAAPYARLEVRGASIAAYSLQAGGPVNSMAGTQLYLGDGHFYLPDYWNSAPGIGAMVDPGGVAGSLAIFAYGGLSATRSVIAIASHNGHSDRALSPGADNLVLLGRPELRWSNIYAASGAITTSDARDKLWLGPMTEPERQAALAIMAELGLFQWNRSLDAKGTDEARRHFGVRAQTAFAIMQGHGLDWRRYGWCCHDRWQDEDGEHERYGIRSDQLGLFLIAALAQTVFAMAAGPADAAG